CPAPHCEGAYDLSRAYVPNSNALARSTATGCDQCTVRAGAERRHTIRVAHDWSGSLALGDIKALNIPACRIDRPRRIAVGCESQPLARRAQQAVCQSDELATPAFQIGASDPLEVLRVGGSRLNASRQPEHAGCDIALACLR